MYEFLKIAAGVCSLFFWASIFTRRTAFMFKERSKKKGLLFWGILCIALGMLAASDPDNKRDDAQHIPQTAAVETQPQTEQPQVIKSQEAQPVTQPEMMCSVSSFMESYNKKASKLGLSLLSPNAVKDSAGVIHQIFLTKYSVVTMVTNSGRKSLISLTFNGAGDGTQQSGMLILTSLLNTISAILDDYTEEDLNGIFSKLGLFDASGTIEARTVPTEHFIFSLSSNDTVGLILTVEPALTKTPTLKTQEEQHAPAKDTFATLYQELLDFKDEKDFHDIGFTIGGPYNSWLVRVNAANLGDLRQMGMDYMRNKGQETEFTQYIKKEKGLK